MQIELPKYPQGESRTCYKESGCHLLNLHKINYNIRLWLGPGAGGEGPNFQFVSSREPHFQGVTYTLEEGMGSVGTKMSHCARRW